MLQMPTIENIRDLWVSGKSQRQISRMLGVSSWEASSMMASEKCFTLKSKRWLVRVTTVPTTMGTSSMRRRASARLRSPSARRLRR